LVTAVREEIGIEFVTAEPRKMPNDLRGPQIGWLVFACVLTLAGAAFSLLTFAFTNDPNDHNIFHKAIWLAPLIGAPMFLLAFISRRVLSWAVWSVWIAGCIGTLVVNLEDRTSIFHGMLAALANVPAIITLLSALIVQYVASSENRETRETRQTIANS
jgi:hypothetical protein